MCPFDQLPSSSEEKYEEMKGSRDATVTVVGKTSRSNSESLDRLIANWFDSFLATKLLFIHPYTWKIWTHFDVPKPFMLALNPTRNSWGSCSIAF